MYCWGMALGLTAAKQRIKTGSRAQPSMYDQNCTPLAAEHDLSPGKGHCVAVGFILAA